MTSSSQPSISPYQNAILTEIEISNWALSVSNKTEAPTVNEPKELEPLTSELKSSISKVDALAKLKQLKSSSSQLKETTAVLTTFSQNETSSPLFIDVLRALEITIDKVQHIESGQQNEFRGYPIALLKGEEVSFKNKQLLIPSLDLLDNPNLKKHLWSILQVTKDNS
ncbi:hypothetical protein [uncultured Paraglaciecola sp.]|uniref:DNA polymerase III subunit psi n=1 Tax=uncultured Paraglaciecola sp. TaxID=1765024 RepID=UPI00259AC495|nr:hypothetical protein [uncultured Paraglaciecola sp.]